MWVYYLKNENKPYMFCKVKVTEYNYEHHCELSETFYNVAIKSKRGKVKVSIEGIHALLPIPKDIPQATPPTFSPVNVEIHKPINFIMH